ncbi:MAG: hypothetical protein H6581_25940 [Bacteroidia bacterium]|nr:hypothetical protein [Bacteroidia bacterium]
MRNLLHTCLTCLILLSGLRLSAQPTLFLLDTLVLDNQETQSTRRFRSPETWMEGQTFRVLDRQLAAVFEFDLSGNKLQTTLAGPSYRENKPLRDLWRYLFRRKNPLMLDYALPVHRFGFQKHTVLAHGIFYILDQRDCFVRLQMGINPGREGRKKHLRSPDSYGLFPWQTPDYQQLGIPFTAWRRPRTFPRQESEYSFGLAFCNLSTQPRPKIRCNKLQIIPFHGKAGPDFLNALGVNWLFSNHDGGNRLFLSHHATDTIVELDAQGKMVQKAAFPPAHLNAVPFTPPSPVKLSRKPEKINPIRENQQQWFLQANYHLALVYDPENQLLFRQYKQGVSDTSSPGLSPADHQFMLGEQILQSPKWLQIIDASQPLTLLAELPLPPNQKILGARGGILYTLAPFNFKEQKLLVIRYQIKIP